MDSDPKASSPRRRIWLEVLALYLVSCITIRLIKEGVDGLGLAPDWLVLVALVFFYTPVLAEHWNGYRVPARILFPDSRQMTLRGLPFARGREIVIGIPLLAPALKWWLLLVMLIYPVFIPGYHLWQSWGFHQLTVDVLTWSGENDVIRWITSDLFHLRAPYPRFFPDFAARGLPDDLLLIVLYQLICVGYAEEFFYRGYLQTRFDSILRPDRFRFLGATFGWSLPLTAVLFTLGHVLVEPKLWQPFIIFPALAFGWLRCRTGSILPGTLFHAWANTVMIVLDHIYGITSPGA